MFLQRSTATCRPYFPFAPCALFLVCLLATAHVHAQRIDRVEPPSWWVGMEHDTVELLISGRDLAGLSARFDRSGPVILDQTMGANPNHLFLTVHIPRACQPGDYQLSLTGLRGAAKVVFPVMERLLTEDRHQGFGPADVLYLITPDRFADGSAANNYGDAPDHLPPAVDPGGTSLSLEFDREAPGGWHGGDLMGIIQRLPYLADLGVTTLWINPFLENAGPGSYHGYATTNLYRVDPRFGHNDVFAELVEAAHLKGLKIVFDHVNNHVGVFHPWVADPPTTTWFHGTVAEHERDPHHLPAYLDPHAAPGVLEQVHTGWFVDAMPDLNQRDPRVARYLIQQSIWWVEFSGMDGIREDTYPYVYPSFSAAWLRALAREYPRLTVVGECWGSTAFTALFQEDSPLAKAIQTEALQTGVLQTEEKNDRSNKTSVRLDALSVVMDFGLMTAMDRFLRGQSNLYPVYERLAEDALFADPSMLVTFLGNHDIERALFRSGGDTARTLLAMKLLLTLRGIPQLLYGEEIGIMGGASHETLRANFPGGFPETVGANPRSAFSAEGRNAGENRFFNATREMLHIRKQHPALQVGNLIQLTPRWDGIWAFLRQHESGDVLILVNSSEQVRNIEYAYLTPLLEKEPLVLKDASHGDNLPFGPGMSWPIRPMHATVLLIVHP